MGLWRPGNLPVLDSEYGDRTETRAKEGPNSQRARYGAKGVGMERVSGVFVWTGVGGSEPQQIQQCRAHVVDTDR